jgi:predicted nucleic acid-binding Zn ribbon protein
MGKASDWLREERRKTLGDWVAFCLGCGHAQRYVAELEADLPAECPQCGGELRVRCPGCDARIASMFAVECEECGGALRPAEGYGASIRKPGK